MASEAMQLMTARCKRIASDKYITRAMCAPNGLQILMNATVSPTIATVVLNAMAICTCGAQRASSRPKRHAQRRASLGRAVRARARRRAARTGAWRLESGWNGCRHFFVRGNAWAGAKNQYV